MPTMEHRPLRVVIDALSPEIDGGRFPIKRTVGEDVVVLADAFGEGHDLVACELLHRDESTESWTVVSMEPLGNDRYRGAFRVEHLGRHLYTVRARIDRFGTWSADLEKRLIAGQDVGVDLRIGAEIVAAAARRAEGADARALARHAERLEAGGEAAAGARAFRRARRTCQTVR